MSGAAGDPSPTTAPARGLTPLVGLALAASVLLLAEGAARLLAPAPGWAEALPPKPPGVVRIVVAGGSTAAGGHVPELGFPAQLAHALPRWAPRRRVQLLDVAKSGEPSTYVRRVVEHVLADGEPDVLVVLTAHNEFLHGDDTTATARAAAWLGERSALYRVLARALAPAPGDVDARAAVEAERRRPVLRDSPRYRRALERFRRNLRRIADAAAARRVPLLLLTGPSNVRDWPPSSVAGADEARRAWEAGRAALAAGHPDEARPRLLAARDLDPIPTRAPAALNDAVRALADAEGVTLVDAERLFESLAPDGLVGFALVSDNVHPTPIGNAHIARALLDALAARVAWARAPADPDAPEAILERTLASPGAPRWRALERDYLYRNGIYCLAAPSQPWAAARSYLERARDLAPNRWDVWANLATAEILLGDTDAGRESWRRAEQLKGSPLAPDDRRAVPLLAEARARLDAAGASRAAGDQSKM